MDCAVEPLEATCERPIVLGTVGRGKTRNMPLPDRIATVAGGLEHFRDRAVLLIQVAAVAIETEVRHHVADAGLMRIETCEQARARRTAAGGVVKLRKAQPAGSERV